GWAGGPKQGKRAAASKEKAAAQKKASPTPSDQPTGTAVPDAPEKPAPAARAAVPDYAPSTADKVDPRDATVLIRVASSLRHGRGSGFVIGDGGWVVTAFHVVAANLGKGRMVPEGALLVLSPWTGHWYEAQA